MTNPAVPPAGRVVLVSTPIGNLGDLSPRALAALADADIICCEDTRRTRALLSALGLSAGDRLLALHAHNEQAASAKAVGRALAGATVAVVSDAGTPVVSDPGERLVRHAAAQGVDVDVIPGPSAALAALTVSGLPADRWVFEGFLPRRGSERRARLAEVGLERRTTVIFESPLRVEATLADLRDACGDERPVVCARELTKLHQEVWRGTIAAALGWVAAKPPRGEWVLVVGGATPPAADAEAVGAALEAARRRGQDRRGAVAAVARDLAVSKKAVYAAALALEWPAP